MDNNENYFSFTPSEVASIGWTHAYAGMKNDCRNLIKSLFGKVSHKDLVKYVAYYLSGYEIGCVIEDIPNFYDETGEIKEEFIVETEEFSKKLLQNYIEKEFL